MMGFRHKASKSQRFTKIIFVRLGVFVAEIVSE
jgi:hypothetical protein